MHKVMKDFDTVAREAFRKKKPAEERFPQWAFLCGFFSFTSAPAFPEPTVGRQLPDGISRRREEHGCGEGDFVVAGIPDVVYQQGDFVLLGVGYGEADVDGVGDAVADDRFLCEGVRGIAAVEDGLCPGIGSVDLIGRGLWSRGDRRKRLRRLRFRS